MMHERNISTWKIAGTYIGTVIGAGFATGQEVLQFFVSFGASGLLGIALTTVLFAVLGYIIMELGLRLHARSHLEIITHAGGRAVGAVMDIVVSFFLFGSVTAMIAGTGALFAQQFGLPPMLGSLAMAAISVLTVFSGTNGVINSISAIVPFLLVSVLGISIYSITQAPPDVAAAAAGSDAGLVHNWLLSAIIYASYNIVMSIAVLGPLGARAKNKRTVATGAMLGALGLGCGAMMIFFALCSNHPAIRGLEVPMAHIAGSISRTVQLVYTVVLIAEIYSTCVGSLYGFTVRMADLDRSPRRARAIVIVTAVAAFFASLFGFTNLVKYLYPIIGYCGILMLLCLLFRKVTERPMCHTKRK